MDALWAGLVGALAGSVVGGLFTLIGSRMQTKATSNATGWQIESAIRMHSAQRHLDARHTALLEMLRVLSQVLSDWDDKESMVLRLRRVEQALLVFEPFLDQQTARMISELLLPVPDGWNESWKSRILIDRIKHLQRKLGV